MGGQIQRANEPVVPREIKDGVLGRFHACSMFHNTGYSQLSPTFRNAFCAGRGRPNSHSTSRHFAPRQR